LLSDINLKSINPLTICSLITKMSQLKIKNKMMQMLLSHKMISNAPLVPNPFLIRAILKDTRRSHAPRMINLRGSKNPQRSTSSAGFAIRLSHLRRSSFIIRSMVTLGMKLCHLMLILLLCYPKDQRRVSQILPRQLSSKKRSSKSLIKFSKT
jgi:hypothetical protein